LIQGYAQLGYVDDARVMFDTMVAKTIVSWNIMVTAYAQVGHSLKAIHAFNKMPTHNVVSWMVVVQACIDSSLASELAVSTYTRMSSWNLVSWNSIMSVYLVTGHDQKVKEILDATPEKDVITWNTIVTAFASSRPSEALAMFREMLLDGVNPDEVSVTGALAALSHLGQAQDCYQFFVGIWSDFGVNPSREHYCCVVDLLARLGELGDAEEVTRVVDKTVSSTVAWGCLLSACRAQGSLEHGVRAAQHAIALEPWKISAYSMLSNVIA
ncbi:hypothetical protein SELMODRAFT_34582, partial [Selaginella moellendorffii]